MRAKPLLSICIPTYNRAPLLQQALESILAQAEPAMRDALEIVISDNASTDGTDSVVAALRAKSLVEIKYFKNMDNVGFDGNCLKAVERATGQYVWLLGSDDLLSSNALPFLLKELGRKEAVDIYLSEKEDFLLLPDHPMRFRRFMKYPGEITFDFRRKGALDSYFKQNKKLIAYLNYISTVVFKRAGWLGVEDKESYIGSGYVHLYVFWSMLWGKAPGIMKYLPVPLVNRRWGNDGSVDPEMRLTQDVKMYRWIAEKVFTNSRHIYLIDDMVIRNDGFSWAVRAKLKSPQRFWFVILPFMFKYYWGHILFWVKIIPLAFMPNLLVGLMRWIYRKEVKGEPIDTQEIMAH